MIGSVEPQKEVFEPQKGGFQCFFFGGGEVRPKTWGLSPDEVFGLPKWGS